MVPLRPESFAAVPALSDFPIRTMRRDAALRRVARDGLPTAHGTFPFIEKPAIRLQPACGTSNAHPTY